MEEVVLRERARPSEDVLADVVTHEWARKEIPRIILASTFFGQVIALVESSLRIDIGEMVDPVYH